MGNSSPTAGNHCLPETTSSRCITESVTATLNLELADYLKLRGKGVGKYVSSRAFRVAGYDWAIRFYPDGVNDACAGNASSTYVYCAGGGGGKDARARFTLSMLEKDGSYQQVQVASFRATEQVFSPGKDWGHPEFVKKSKLESSWRLGNGCFTIRCVLTVVNESPPLELPGHLERMMKDGRGADVTFDVGGREFPAHRSLLASRSPVFDAQLFVGPRATTEKDLRRVEVADMEPAIFEMLLHYVYTDSLLPCDGEGGCRCNAAVMQHLLVAADRLGLDRLKSMCEEELCKRIDVKTITSTLALADRHHCERLKDACLWRL